MCGGTYVNIKHPKHLLKVNGEEIVARTIRLLKENGVEDISISTNNPVFEKFGLPILKHENHYVVRQYNDFDGYWCNAFYPTDEPTCYIFGDVIFSPEAIKTIVETETGDIEFFASAPPFAENYPKQYVEPFAFKVVNTKHFKKAIQRVKDLDKLGKFNRKPISWELWAVIKGTNLNKRRNNYTVINDYTCDIDSDSEIPLIEKIVKSME